MINKNINTLAKLSDRQKEVLEGVAMGYSVKEIADVLEISESTVENHINNIKRATGAQKNTELSIVFFCRIKGWTIKDLFTKGLLPVALLIMLTISQLFSGNNYTRSIRSGKTVRIARTSTGSQRTRKEFII